MMKNDIASIMEAQKNHIRRITEEVIEEKVIPRLDGLDEAVLANRGAIMETKAASETAHKSILETLDDITARLDRLERRG